MPDALRVFVNGTGLDVPGGATALDAVRAADPAAAAAIDRGERAVSDSRGLPLPPDTPAFAGAIYRVIRAAER